MALIATGKTHVRLESGLNRDISEGDWRSNCDQAVTNGVDGPGPDPGFFGRGALDACAAQAYAICFAEHGLSFRSIEVEVEIETDIDGRGHMGVGTGIPTGYQLVRCIVTVESDEKEQDILEALDHAALGPSFRKRIMMRWISVILPTGIPLNFPCSRMVFSSLTR